MSERIEAPEQIIETLERIRQQQQVLAAQAEALLFGASVALRVPDGWQFDGSGWSEPAPSNVLGESQLATSQSN